MAKFVTYLAPINMATIKYWGKRDEKLILPLHDSISVTISVDVMHAKTTVSASPKYKENEIWLNGAKENFDDNPRLISCLTTLQERARNQKNVPEDTLKWKIRICSENNFPTAAGLASSAAGYACLVVALARLYNIKGDITSIARRGSGSACRSLHGGFVQWHKGSQDDGSDSIATQVVPASHWPELRILLLIVKKEKKAISSSRGMQLSVQTSELLSYRATEVVPKRVEAMKAAILAKDFETFAKITIKDSNQFHAIALDTFPPCIYMTDVSHSIAALVHAFNEASQKVRVAYTFDAGANACLFFEQNDASLIYSLIENYFPADSREFRGEKISLIQLPEDLKRQIGIKPFAKGMIDGLIYAKAGDGPVELVHGPHLLDESGFPLSLKTQ